MEPRKRICLVLTVLFFTEALLLAMVVMVSFFQVGQTSFIIREFVFLGAGGLVGAVAIFLIGFFVSLINEWLR